MMIVNYSILIFIIGLSFNEGVYHKKDTISNDELRSLSMDEAYLILQNTNSTNSIALFGNKIICESCDLERLIVRGPNISPTRIINTKYAYNLEVRTLLPNETVLCEITKYQFAEHGTYVLTVEESSSTTAVCSIKQIGNPSNYMTPAILGIFFIVFYTLLVQLWPYLYRSQYFVHFRTNILHQPPINDKKSSTSIENMHQQPENESNEINRNDDKLSLPNNKIPKKRVLPKRLRALDTFRGFALMVMIFVNYGGGGYWYFDHSIWNGLTLADLLFPWFTWMMGVSIVLSQRSLRKKNVRKLSILLKICRRTIILFCLGFTGQDDKHMLKDLRILGVLQRLAICYCFTAILVLFTDKDDDHQGDSTRLINDDAERSLGSELFKTVFRYWLQWFFVMLSVTTWLLITFLLHVSNCPTGYLGPGGKHDHGKYQNCTGGAAGYVDHVVLGYSHLYDQPTCQEIYDTKVPYDPEGIMGNLTGILLCYLGVQAGHIFIHSSRVRRICIHWLVWGIICGGLGLLLSKGGHTSGWIPINKNLWSLTFVLTLSSLAFMILTVLYLLVDVRQWFTGGPFLWMGMNSIAIYIGHDRFSNSFPVQFEVNNSHAEQLAVHLYGAFFWSVVAGLMYRKKFFIAI